MNDHLAVSEGQWVGRGCWMEGRLIRDPDVAIGRFRRLATVLELDAKVLAIAAFSLELVGFVSFIGTVV